MKKRRIEIDIAKGIGIILVVLGHAFPDATTGIENDIARTIFNVIYSFHMPLFIFLSGIVAGKVLYIQDKKEKEQYIIDRVSRLMVPYIILSILYIPIKLMTGRMANNPYKVSDIWKLILGESPNYALWTLYVLFILSIVAIIFSNARNINYILAISIVMWILGNVFWQGVPVGVSMLTRVGIYYFLGLFISQYDTQKINKTVNSKIIVLISGIVFLLANYISFICKFELVGLLKIFAAFSGISLVIALSNKLVQKGLGKVLTLIGQYSMDIYIISTFIQPLFKFIFYQKISLNYCAYIVVCVIFTVGTSIAVSKYIVRKIKVLRVFFLGIKKDSKSKT